MGDPISKTATASNKTATASNKTATASSKTAAPWGSLFVVATPIGNLGDISHRALETLSKVSVVLAEDTRHSRRLFNHYGISTKLRSCHEHNEAELLAWAEDQLNTGCDIALISDAGTPLISDPGFVLVRSLRAKGHRVCAVPGASSIIAALSVAGLATNQFVFDGFLPAKSAARRAHLAAYLAQTRTIVLFESSHRIVASLEDIAVVLGGERRLVIARELTKKFETVIRGTVSELVRVLQQDANQTRGEFVLLIDGAPPATPDHTARRAVLNALMSELPIKQASRLAAKISGGRKNELYQLALTLKAQHADGGEHE